MIGRGSFLVVLLLSTALAYPEDNNYEYEEYPEEEETGEEGPPPDFVVSSSQHLVVKEGSTIIIPCKLTGETNYALMIKKAGKGEKEPTLLFLDTVKVPRSNRYNRYTFVSGDMEISKVRPNDAGTYICQLVTDDKPEVHHVLEVQYAPRLTLMVPEEQRVVKGQSVMLKCEADGNPKPKIFWSKMKGKLPSGEEQEEGLSMTLENVDRHVEGTYKCSAQNGIGNTANATMKVIVDSPPEINIEKAIVRTGEGDMVEMVCIVHARPSAQVTWKKDGYQVNFDHQQEEHERGHRHSLIIPKVSEDDFGNYQCTATNEYGEEIQSVHLTGHPMKPNITSEANGGEETSHTITWDTESYYPILQYRLRYRKIKANDSSDHLGEWHEETFQASDHNSEGLHHSFSHTLEHLEPATDYHGVLQVKNEFTWSASTEFTFSTKKDMIDQQPLSGAPASVGSSGVLLLLLPALLLRT